MSKIKSIIAASLVASVLLVGCTKGSQEKPVPPENVPNDTSVVASAVTVPPASESVDAAVSDVPVSNAVDGAELPESSTTVVSDVAPVSQSDTPVPDKNASATDSTDYEFPLPEPSSDAVAKISKDCKLSEAQMLEKIQAYADSICPYVDVKPDILRIVVGDDKSVSFDAINVVDGKETVVYSVKSYKNVLDAFTCLYEMKDLDIDGNIVAERPEAGTSKTQAK